MYMKVLHSNQKYWLIWFASWAWLSDSLFQTDKLRVPLLTDWHPSHLVLQVFRRHYSFCGLRTNIDEERFSGHSSAASKIPEIRSPSLATHLQTHTETHTYTSIQIIMPQRSMKTYLFLLGFILFLHVYVSSLLLSSGQHIVQGLVNSVLNESWIIWLQVSLSTPLPYVALTKATSWKHTHVRTKKS